MKTWSEGAAHAIETMMASINKNDYLTELRKLYDGYMTDDVDYRELGLIAFKSMQEDVNNTNILEGTRRLLVSKQHDYGNQNITRFGHGGIGIRINDKICRLENLVNKDHQVDEALAETWQDILGYCIIGIMMHEETFSLPLESPETWAQSIASIFNR